MIHKTTIFAKSFPYVLLNFLTQKSIKRFLFNRSGIVPSPIQFGNHQGFKSILLIAPSDSEQISKLAPFVHKLNSSVDKNSVTILCALEHKDIVANFNKKILTLPLNSFIYGEKNFKALATQIKKEGFDLVLYLDTVESLPKLFLACVSGAKYRVGINSETLSPFLNISLNLSNGSEYKTLYDQLKMHVGI